MLLEVVNHENCAKFGYKYNPSFDYDPHGIRFINFDN